MVDVFISYDHRDKDRVGLIVEEVERRGWEVFWDRDLLPGEDFGNRLQAVIDESRCVVVFWTARSVASKWVKAEATHALTRSRLIPVMLDEVDLPFPFNTHDTLDLRGWPDHETEASFRRLLNEISRGSEDQASAEQRVVDPRLSIRLAKKVVDAITRPAVANSIEVLAGQLSEPELHRFLIACGHLDQLTPSSLMLAHQMLIVLSRERPDVESVAEVRDRTAWWLALYGDSPEREASSAFARENDAVFEATLAARMESPNEQDLMLYGVHVLLPAGCHREAVSYLEQAERCDPLSAEIKLHLARASLLTFDFGRALNRISVCLRLAPAAPIALLLHTITTSQLGKMALADLSASQLRGGVFAELARQVAGGDRPAIDALTQVESAMSRRLEPLQLTEAPLRDRPAQSAALGMRALARLRALQR